MCLKVLYYPHFISVLYTLHVCVSLSIHIFCFKLLYSILLLIKLLLQLQGRLFGFRNRTPSFLKCCSSSHPWCITFWLEQPTPSLGKVVSGWKGGFWGRTLRCKFKAAVCCTGKEEWCNSLGYTVETWLQRLTEQRTDADPTPNRENSLPLH